MAEPITGINAVVTLNTVLLDHCRKWSVSETADNQLFADSGTGGEKHSALGQKTHTFTADFFTDGSAIPTLRAGLAITAAVFDTDGSTPLTFAAGRVDSIDNLEADIEGSGMIAFTMAGTLWTRS